MSNDLGLIHAHLLDGKGRSTPLTLEQVHQWVPEQGVLWLHFDYSQPQFAEWLVEKAHLSQVIADALVADETRPRATVINDGLLIALRGINAATYLQDMISLRIWAESSRIITSRRRKLDAANQVISALENGQGPLDTGDFLSWLIYLITDGISDKIDEFEERVADCEDALLTDVPDRDLRNALSVLRRETITIRRYLAPQRDAFGRLLIEKVSWLNEEHRIEIRESSDRLIRHIENLDAARERAVLTQEELLSRTSEQMNSRMYVLSIVAAIFLPLGFLTGLLGINVGGIPGAENDQAFWIFIAILAVVVIFQVCLFRWKKLF